MEDGVHQILGGGVVRTGRIEEDVGQVMERLEGRWVRDIKDRGRRREAEAPEPRPVPWSGGEWDHLILVLKSRRAYDLLQPQGFVEGVLGDRDQGIRGGIDGFLAGAVVAPPMLATKVGTLASEDVVPVAARCDDSIEERDCGQRDVHDVGRKVRPSVSPLHRGCRWVV